MTPFADVYNSSAVCSQSAVCLLFINIILQQTPLKYLTYDGNDFVADFGGYLGLLLGHSILTFYDWIVLMIEKMKEGSKMVK